VAKSEASLATVFHAAVRTHALRHVTLASVVDIVSVDGAQETLARLVDDAGVEADVKEAARTELAALQQAAT